MRTSILGLLVILALVLTAPVVAAEETPWEWPSFDLVGWVVDLLDGFWLESSTEEMGPAIDPLGEEGPTAEIGPAYEPGGEEAPTAEIGPNAEPNG